MYMDSVEIKAFSRRIPAILDATDEELSFWMDEAFDEINAFCQQDFVYEKQVTRRVRATTSTLVYLPKVLSGNVIISSSSGGSVLFDSNTVFNDPFVDVPINSSFEFFPGTFTFGYYGRNTAYRSPNAQTFLVTGDWGFALTQEALLVDFVNSLKANYIAHAADITSHIIADVVNVVLSPNATDLVTAFTLLNELKAVINAHMGDTAVHTNADTNTTTVADAVDTSTAFVLAEDLKSKYNDHLLKDANSNPAIHLAADTTNNSTASTDNINAVMPRQLRRVFLRLVQRIAIRDDAEDHRQINSPYTSETLGDGYSYDLGNGTLRNIIRPQDANMLLPYVNRGWVV